MEQLKLFDDRDQLLLPQHLMTYEPEFISAAESDQYLNTFLRTVPFQQSKVVMYEKEVLTPRLTAWFGDRPIRDGDQRPPISWTKELLEIKSKVEDFTGIVFNGVLLNYYRDGNDSVAWHSDKDTIVGLKTEVASVSLGQPRNFDFRNIENHRQQYSLELGNGSLLLMKGDLQKYWEHRIAKSNKPMGARINLTFRKVT
ncbi:alpha-ketoglutarate-dependent dioxygenase AlkB [Dyadobacter sp. CY323]|uniref:alpha-ketoglutarate-dependent dioxygenase AlkB family protein n=1 Tax=Dyadobacter sp. CY323 TaxID=2907302 RepID=UPI001F2C04D6|nr:alpha-ketoglutarate-dependent dioxygenase AlkB [Dyadobacter sp. CY323]MCE6988059.1 alpha-ketoglutarate-dependent dioxygenase AlkB [Dyadobacter sp. CY323]